MVVTLQLRRGAANPRGLSGRRARRSLQRDGYPDIVPIVLPAAGEAFKRVDRAAMALGWDVVARAPAEGRLEAIDTSDWFGFRDDIVVRSRRRRHDRQPGRHPLQEPRSASPTSASTRGASVTFSDGSRAEQWLPPLRGFHEGEVAASYAAGGVIGNATGAHDPPSP